LRLGDESQIAALRKLAARSKKRAISAPLFEESGKDATESAASAPETRFGKHQRG
jgi:hypothetical protein